MIATPTLAQTVHEIDPLQDARWDQFVEHHPQSSVFHTRGWLEALRRTYRYRPVVVTTSRPGIALENGWAFCSIDSWITGRRWVSLPFSDHCQPLTGDVVCHDRFLSALEKLLGNERLRYLETRPFQPLECTLSPHFGGLLHSTMTYSLHQVDLTPDLDTLFANCHKDSTRRKIQRAEREQLRYEDGQSARLLDAFYKLQVLTRRRHGLPPQPRRWFQNVVECLGKAVKVRVAYRDNQPIAAILTISHKKTVMYKYGCSDAAHNNLGGMHLLLWKTIEEAKRDGLRTLDLGRSDNDNEGLIKFKDRWGSRRLELCYSRFTSELSPRDVYAHPYGVGNGRLSRTFFAHMPDAFVRAMGELLYRHIG